MEREIFGGCHLNFARLITTSHSSQTWIPHHPPYCGDPVHAPAIPRWCTPAMDSKQELFAQSSHGILKEANIHPKSSWIEKANIRPNLKKKKTHLFMQANPPPLLSEVPQHQCIWWRWTCAQKDLPQKASAHPSWQVIFQTLQGCTRWDDEICWQAALSVHRYLSTAHPQDVKSKSYWKDVDRGSWCFKRMCEKTSFISP